MLFLCIASFMYLSISVYTLNGYIIVVKNDFSDFFVILAANFL